MSLFPTRLNEGLPKGNSGFKQSSAKYVGFPKSSNNGLPRGNGYVGVIESLKTLEDMGLDENNTKVKINEEVKESVNEIVDKLVLA